MLAVRWYLRSGLWYRDVEELLAERGVVVDHVSVYRWVQPFAPLLRDIDPRTSLSVEDAKYCTSGGAWRNRLNAAPDGPFSTKRV